MHTQKVTSKTSLTNKSKNEKSAYFRHVYANNFFGCIFSTDSKSAWNSTDSKSAWNSAFFDTHIEFCNKFFVVALISTFVHFDCKWAGNGSKKLKIFFYECVLEFY